jgi:hypothetical protein
MPRRPPKVYPGRISDPVLREEFAKMAKALDQNSRALKVLVPGEPDPTLRQSTGRRGMQTPYANPGPDYLRLSRPSTTWDFDRIITIKAPTSGAVDIGSDIQAAIDSAPTDVRCTIVVPPGDWTVSDTIKLKSNIALKGTPGSTTLTQLTNDPVITIQGTSGSDISLAADADIGTSSVTLTTGHGLSVGDLIVLSSDDHWVENGIYDSQSPQVGQLANIVAITTGTTTDTIIIDSTIVGDLAQLYGLRTAANAYVRLITPVTNVLIQDLKVVPYPRVDNGVTYGIYVDRCSGVWFNRCEVVCSAGYSTWVDLSQHVGFTNYVQTENSTYDSIDAYGTGTATLRYGTGVRSVRDVGFISCRFEQCFNGIVINSGGSLGPAMHVRVAGCFFSGIRGWGGVDSHVSGFDWSIMNCQFVGSNVTNPYDSQTNTAGVKAAYVRDFRIGSCTFSGWADGVLAVAPRGIEIGSCSFTDCHTAMDFSQETGAATGPVGLARIKILQNNILRCIYTAGGVHSDRGYGIRLKMSNATEPVEGVQIIMNSIKTFGLGGIQFRLGTFNAVKVIHNHIEDNQNGGTISGVNTPAIYFRDATMVDMEMESNQAVNIQDSSTIEREVGTNTFTRVHRHDNRTKNTDGNFWDNDPHKHTASEAYYSNSKATTGALHGSSFGGYNELATPVTAQNRSIAKFALINYARTADPEDVCTLTSTKVYEADGSEDSPGTTVITLDKSLHEAGDVFWFDELHLGYSTGTLLTLVQSAGYGVGLLHGSSFTNGGEMFRVTRVGWRCITASAFGAGAIDCVFYGIKTKGASVTAGSWKQEIADLSETSARIGGSNGDHVTRYQDVDWLFNDPNDQGVIYPADADSIGNEGIWAEWEFASSPADGYQMMEVFFEYETDFRVADEGTQ